MSIPAESEDQAHHRSFELVLDDGITAFYQSEWEKARSVFAELRSRNEDDPRPYFFESMLPFWKYFFVEESTEAAAEFLEKSEKAIQVAGKWLNSNPDDSTTVLMMGGLYGYRGLVAAGERQYRTAVKSGANGLSFTRKLMRMGPDNPDALIGQGVFHYMMGTIPREARWLTGLIGLSGNRQTGLEKLELAAGLDTYTSTDARMILTYIYHEEEKFEEAVRVVEPLVEDWPENIIFRYYFALSLEKSGQTDRASEEYRKIARNEHPELGAIHEKGAKRLKALAGD